MSYEQGIKIADFRFVTVDIANVPDDWENAKSAINATAELSLSAGGREGRPIQFARWSDRDVPLFPRDVEHIKSLKQITIDPGHPESLVLGYRKSRGSHFHGFYYTDHKEILQMSTRRRIGAPPINGIVQLRGRFMPTRFELEITRGRQGVFIVKEIHRKRVWSYWPGLRVMPKTLSEIPNLD